MKKNTYRLKNIDCASCALKIEDGVSKLEGVSSCSLNFIFLKFYVTFDENIVREEDIELKIHKSLSGVIITEKNDEPYIDTYQEEVKTFKKILFGGRKRK